MRYERHRRRRNRESTPTFTLLDSTDYCPYPPLLPQVAADLLEPRRVTTLTYDRLVLAVGGVNKLLPVPGVAEYAHGFRGLPEALCLRDHVTRQVEPAAASDDPKSCAARCTFVVVGAGYTGTEVAAQRQPFTDALVHTPMTAQHAWRRGKVAGRNVTASLGIGSRRAYRHRDLGFTVDLGGAQAAANPLGIPLSGPLAGAVTSPRCPCNRVRVAADRLLDAASPEPARVAGSPGDLARRPEGES